MQNSKIVAQTHPGETAHFGFCPPQIGFFRGVGGVPEIFFSLESSYFCDFRSPCKKLKSYDTPLRHFSNGGDNNNKSGKIYQK